MANKVKYGLRNVYYAKLIETAGVITFDKPKRIPGAVSLTLDPEGEILPFYADDMVYHQTVTNQGYTGTLEIAMIPEEFATDILGETLTDSNVITESSDDKSSAFALMFELQGDKKATRHLYYNCTASRAGVNAGTTGDNNDPQTDELSFSATSHPETRNIKTKTTATTEADVYNNWFNEVFEEPTLP